MAEEMILGYRAIRGLAQSIRMVLHYTKTPFVDKMYEQGGPPDYIQEDWLNEKFNLGLDFPNLPYLIDNDLKLTQSKAILYYLGRKYNLMGTTLEEEAHVMMLSEESYDLHVQFAMFCYGPNGGSDTERKRFVETSLSDSLKKFDDYLGKKTSKFVVGNQITIADFQVFHCLDICFLLDDDNILPKKFSNITHYMHDFRQLPELKNYIETSEKKLAVNSPNANFGAKVIEKRMQ